MRMKIIERIKELQPDNWPQSEITNREEHDMISWMFSPSDRLVSFLSIDATMKDADGYNVDDYANSVLKLAISAYNERFPDGH